MIISQHWQTSKTSPVCKGLHTEFRLFLDSFACITGLCFFLYYCTLNTHSDGGRFSTFFHQGTLTVFSVTPFESYSTSKLLFRLHTVEQSGKSWTRSSKAGHKGSRRKCCLVICRFLTYIVMIILYSWLQSFWSSWASVGEWSWCECTRQRRIDTFTQCFFIWGKFIFPCFNGWQSTCFNWLS